MKRVAKKGVLTRDQVINMIENETSMPPSEALQYGFIDDVQEKLRAVAKFDINKFKDMETVTKEELKGAFAAFGEKIDKMLGLSGKFKNSVQVAMSDGTMATSSAATIDEIIGSVMSNDAGVLPDGQYETADGFMMIIAGGEGKVEDYGPKMEDKVDPAQALEAANAEIAALKEQLAAKSNEATTAVQAKAKIEGDFKNQVTVLKNELETLKSKTFGDDTPPTTDPKFKDGEEKHAPAEYGIPSFLNDVSGVFKTKLNK